MYMFKRPINIFVKKILQKQYDDQINADNILSLSSRNIKSIFKGEDEEYKEVFLHNLIDRWWNEQEQNFITFKNLKRIIKTSKIKLNQIEKHNLFLIEERIFSIDRHIKILEVSNPLLKDETVGAKFVNASVYTNDGKLKTFSEGDLLLTNRRILITSSGELSFFWSNIEDPKYPAYGFDFKYKDERFVIRIHDQITLNNTIQNFAKKKVKKWKV